MLPAQNMIFFDFPCEVKNLFFQRTWITWPRQPTAGPKGFLGHCPGARKGRNTDLWSEWVQLFSARGFRQPGFGFAMAFKGYEPG
jgi:hypothetical protein